MRIGQINVNRVGRYIATRRKSTYNYPYRSPSEEAAVNALWDSPAYLKIWTKYSSMKGWMETWGLGPYTYPVGKVELTLAATECQIWEELRAENAKLSQTTKSD